MTKQKQDSNDSQENTQKRMDEHMEKVNDPAGAERDYHNENLEGGDQTKTAETENGNEVTVHVDTTKEADKDPSSEVPVALHTSGTEGVQGIAAGSSNTVAAPTGNAGSGSVQHGAPVQPEAPEKNDVRDLQPSAQEEKQKQDEQENPRDFAVEYEGQKDEELSLRDACKLAYNKLVDGNSMVILYRNGERFATFVSEEKNGQKHVSVKPEDGTISDEEAEILNSYNLRVLTGPIE